jgi:hypothetical protein
MQVEKKKNYGIARTAGEHSVTQRPDMMTGIGANAPFVRQKTPYRLAHAK